MTSIHQPVSSTPWSWNSRITRACVCACVCVCIRWAGDIRQHHLHSGAEAVRRPSRYHHLRHRGAFWPHHYIWPNQKRLGREVHTFFKSLVRSLICDILEFTYCGKWSYLTYLHLAKVCDLRLSLHLKEKLQAAVSNNDNQVNGKLCVWQRPNSAFWDKKHSGGSITVWYCKEANQHP